MRFRSHWVSLSFCVRCTLSVLLLSPRVQAQVNRGEGLPFIRTFTDADTRARPQNYAFTQDEYGLLYVANEDGILQFDGMNTSWQLIPTRSSCYSLAFHQDKEDKKAFVAVGCLNDFGFLEIKDKGQLEFKSLAEPARKKGSVGKITRIEQNGVRLFYLSEKILHWYDRRNYYQLKTDGQFVALFKFNDKVYAVEKNGAQTRLHTFDKKQRQANKSTQVLTTDLPWEAWTGLGNPRGTRALLSFNSAKHPALVWFDPTTSQVQPVGGEISKAVKAATCVQRLVDGRWAVGTRFTGVYLFTDEGEIIRRILPGQSGLTLSDPNVRAMYNVLDRYLWIAFNSGMAAVDLGRTGLSFFDKTSGINGSAYRAVVRFEGHLYTGTSRGLFKYVGGAETNFSPVRGTEDQAIVAAAETQGFLYCIADGVLKRMKGAEMVKASDFQQFTALTRGPVGELYASHAGGILKLEGLEVQPVVTSSGGILDLEATATALVYVLYDRTMFTVPLAGGSPQAITLPPDVPAESVVALHQAYGKVFCSMAKDFWEYMPANRTFERRTIELQPAGEPLNDAEVWTLVQVEDGQTYGFATTPDDYVVFKLNKQLKAELVPVLMRRRFKVYHFSEENGILWVGTSDRLIRLDNKSARALPKHPYKPLVRRLEARFKKQYQTLFYGVFRDAQGLPSTTQTESDVLTIDADAKEVRLNIACPLYGTADGVVYKYRLSQDQPWTVTDQQVVRLVGLGYKDYEFQLQAVDPVNGQESEITTYKFRIAYPWYVDRNQPWLYLFVVSALLLAFATVRFLIWNATRSLEKKNRELEERVAERTRELENSKQREEEKNQQLQDKNIILRETNKTVEYQKRSLEEQNQTILRQRNEIQKLERSRTANMFLPVFAHEFGTALRVMQDATRDTNEKLALASTSVAEVAHQLNDADLEAFTDLLKRLPASLQATPELDAPTQRSLRRAIEAKLAEWNPDQADRYAHLLMLSGLVGSSVQDEVLNLYPKNVRAAEAIRNFAALSAGGLRAEAQSQTAAFKARLFREFFNREFEHHLVPLSISLGMARYLLEYQLSQNLRLEFAGFKPMNALKKANLPETVEPDFLNATAFREGDWTLVDRCRVPYGLNQEWVVLILWSIESIRAEKGKDGQFKVRCEPEPEGVRVILEDSRTLPANGYLVERYQEIFHDGRLPETEDIHEKANFIQLYNARNAFAAGGGLARVEVLNPDTTGGLTWRTSIFLPAEGHWPTN